MTTMVERIARVLCVKEGVDPDAMRTREGCTLGQPCAGWEEFASTAVDLLAAMREPTEVMLHEGWRQSPQIGSAYTAMIEASMAEGEQYKLFR
jgi:hypothetical protein